MLVLIFALATSGLGKHAAAEPVNIAVLGDSLVHGYGLPAAQGFVPQLQTWLTKNQVEATIINAGVSGDTTAGGLARLDWTLTPDVQALVVSLGGNDVLRGLDPAYSRENLRQILQTAGNRGLPVLLVGIAAPGNFGADYKAEFDAIYPSLAAEYGALLYPSFLAALLNLPDRTATLKDLMQADGIHPNARGVALVVDDMAPAVAQLVESVSASR